LAGSDYEIVVVHDGTDDDAARLVERWSERMARARGLVIRFLWTPERRGPAAARNLGWRKASAPIVAFTDDDTVPDRDWLRHALAAFTPDVDALSGRIEMPLCDDPTDYERDAAGLARAEFVTANCCCRRALLLKLGGFDESFPLAWREDSDLHFRLLETGARIVHAPEAVVVHPIRPARWGVSVFQQRKVVFDALLYKKHPKLYRSRIRALPRFDYYAIVAALLTGVAGAAFGSLPIAAAGGAMWLVLTVLFCASRLRHSAKSPRHVGEMIVTSALIPPLAVFWRIVGVVRYRVLFV
jgi:GT2 family glycosyltransferase